MESFVFLSAKECQNMGLTLGGSPFGLSWGTSLPPFRICCLSANLSYLPQIYPITAQSLGRFSFAKLSLFPHFTAAHWLAPLLSRKHTSSKLLSLWMAAFLYYHMYKESKNIHWLFYQTRSAYPLPHTPLQSPTLETSGFTVSLSHMAEIAQLYGGGTDRRLNREWRRR